MAEDSEVWIEDRVNEPLKDGGGGGESHGHDCIFERAEEGFKCGCFFGSGGHSEVGETGADIHGGDPVSSREVVHECAGERDRIFIQNDLTVEVPVIDHESKLS